MSNLAAIKGTFDGEVLRFDEPPGLEPNTRVLIVIKEVLLGDEEPVSALDVAMSLNLDGPPDWARNIDHYLYGHPRDDDPEKSNNAR